MISLLHLLALQTSPLSTESFIQQMGVPLTISDTVRKSDIRYIYTRLDPPYRIELNACFLDSREGQATVLADIRAGSVLPRGFDSLPRELPDQSVLGFGTLHTKLPTRNQIYAFGNHCYVNVIASGIRLPNGNPAESEEREPVPTDTEEVACTLATLFLAEREASDFATTEKQLGEHTYPALRGLDGTFYISVPAYAQAKGVSYQIDRRTGAGIIATTPPIAFNLASIKYKHGEEERNAEHLVVLNDGTTYVPENMLPR